MPTNDRHFYQEGISLEMINRLARAFEKDFGNVRVMIRNTNPGSLLGFEHKYAIGKPLWAKAKSSNSLFASANLTACPVLAKSFNGSEKSASKIANKLDQSIEAGQDDCCFVNKYIPAYDTSATAQYFKQRGFPKVSYNPLAEFFIHDLDKGVKIGNKKDNTKPLEARVILSGEQKRHKNGPTIEFLLMEVSDDAELFTQADVKVSKLRKRYFKHGLGFRYKKRQLFQAFVRIESQANYWKKRVPTWCVELKSSGKRFYPIQILAEKWKGAWYEIVADYDLFAVCPNMEMVDKQEDLDFFLPEEGKYMGTYENLANERVKAYDIDYDKEGANLGFLSPFENEVRKTINRTLGIPLARHGCETLNLFAYSQAKDLGTVVMIDSKKKSKAGSKLPFNDYLGLCSKADSKANFFVPLNPAWGKKDFGLKTKDLNKWLISSIQVQNPKTKNIDLVKLKLLIEYYDRVEKYVTATKLDFKMEMILVEFFDLSDLMPEQT